jgi:TfoX/Sxy family transcriptional regulator of competence genes
MSTSKETAAFIEDQLSGLDIRTGRMFGEFALYCDTKVVGFICDDTLFIKPSSADPALFERTSPGHPYPGSKEYHSVPGDALDDHEWLITAIQSTADALPLPAPKKPRSRSAQGQGNAKSGGAGW